jgi:hypothetical protein
MDVRPAAPAAEPEDDTALRDFLRALLPQDAVGGVAPSFPAAAVLRFQRPGSTGPAATARHDTAPPAPCNLDRLPGAGPGLVWALRRAGLSGLSDIAALEAEDLAARLGPLGRLVPAGAWVLAARDSQAG